MRRALPVLTLAIVALGGAPSGAAALTPAIAEYPVPTASSGPLGIAAGGDGALWFTETSAGAVGRITTAGSVTNQWSVGNSSAPLQIAAGPDGNLWFAESGANRVGRITSGGAIATFPTPAQPTGIAAGPTGDLWFTAGATSGNVDRITTAGAVTQHTTPTSGGAPEGIAAGPDGALWVAQHSGNRIVRVATDGSATQYAIPTSASGPTGIAAGPDGALWFTETQAGKIGRVTTSGAFTEFALASSARWPAAIAAGPDGALWFTEPGNDSIGRITTSGTVSEFALPTASAVPMDITAGPDGNLWFTESWGNAVARITAPPAAATGPAAAVGSTSATLNGTANARSQAATAWVEYGTTTGYGSASPAQALTAGASDQAVSAAVSGLAPAADYHYRVVSRNPTGTTYGPDATFTTEPPPPPPSANASGATVGPTTVLLTATVDPRGLPTTYHFEYGRTPALGSSAPSPDASAGSGAGPVTVSQPVSGLAPGATYYFRIVAANGAGTSSGPVGAFQTVAAGAPAGQPGATPLGGSRPVGAHSSGTTAGGLVSSAPVQVSAAGIATVDVVCPTDCRGTVTITLPAAAPGRGRSSTRAVSASVRRSPPLAVAARCARGCRPLGQQKFTASRGKPKRVRVALTASARTQLAARGRMNVRVTVRTQSLTGPAAPQTSSSSIVLVAPRRASRPLNTPAHAHH